MADPERSDVRVTEQVLVRIVGPTFVAGAVLEGERIVTIAPYLASCMRKAGLVGRQGLRALVRRNRWQAAIVPDHIRVIR